MARCPFLFEFEAYAPGSTSGTVTKLKYRTTYSCVPRVADFLGVKDQQYIADPTDLIKRAGYTRSYFKADGTIGTLTVREGERVYLPYGKANARTVTLKTGRNATTKKRRTLTFTFPSYLGISDIGDALSELLAGKVAEAGTATALQVEPFYTIVGGRTYPLKTSAAAQTTPFPNLAKTPAEEITILAGTVSQRRNADRKSVV